MFCGMMPLTHFIRTNNECLTTDILDYQRAGPPPSPFLMLFFIGRTVLVFCHLLIGSVLGLLIYRRYGHRWAVPVAALGAILPDIIDKPLGHVLLRATLDSGRIYGHTLLFLGIVTLAGLVYLRSRRSPILLVVAVGMVSHLVLDSMWANPTTLLWPSLGDFVPDHYPDYFGKAFWVELTSPLEWLSGLALVVIMLEVFGHSLNGPSDQLLRNADVLRPPLYVLLVLGGAMMILFTILSPPEEWMDLETTLMAGGSVLIAGLVLIHLRFACYGGASTALSVSGKGL